MRQYRYRFTVGAVAWILSAAAVFVLIWWLLSTPTLIHANDKITPNLQATLAESQATDPIRFIIHLEESADFSRTSLPADKVERRAFMVQRLRETAVSSQASLITELEEWQANGRVIHYRPFWIINAIAVEGTADLVHQIATRPEVKKIEPDSIIALIPPPPQPEHEILFHFLPVNPPTKTLSWGIDRIRAPHVWHGLGYDGGGITVAIMDSGVDWLHPDLFPNYRGNLANGTIQHSGNWFNAAIPTMTAPIDFIGHGTHVAGTAVGQNGIGVAPGAKWIAASISDEFGSIFSSYVHAGFEWLLAPNGDPGLAPDIINGSWGGPGANTTFLEDIEILQEAGIILIFSAGNGGPVSESIGAPASYTDTIAIGASDDRDETTWFSARGPSPFTAETHPHLMAPGTRILSTFPGNLYATSNGTSMSAPHVSGVAALLLSANPALSSEQVEQLLLNTAVPISSTHPNHNSGWGRVDAYATVSQQATAGTVLGTVKSQGIPLPGITITITTATGAKIPFATDENGFYQFRLKPGTYDLIVDSFGFEPHHISGLTITHPNHTLVHHIDLTALPAGTLTGIIRGSDNGETLAATIRAEGTPIMAETDSSGHYTLTLPAGQYDLTVQAIGRRLGRVTLPFVAGQTNYRNFYLTPGPAILLVDSGPWYYRSQIDYFSDGLTALDYGYKLWEVRNPFTGAPTYADLQPYDTVVWAAPEDAPGVVAAGQTITQFLKAGGNFLVSGQNVGSYDGSGFGTQLWWYRDLEARYTGPATTDTLVGASGSLFEGLSFDLNGPDTAQNQFEPDTSQPDAGSLTAPIFQYGDGLAGGLQRSHCKPFGLVYLGFGLEGVTGSANRLAILERTFAYFNAPPVDTGVRWQSADIDDYALWGEQLVYTVTIQNLSETVTDTFHFQLDNSEWATSLITSSLTIGPCQTGHTVFTVDVPANLPRDTIHTMQLTAVSTNAPSFSDQLNIRHKLPGRTLFVDDDRWYDREDAISHSLDQMGVTYDIWETGWDRRDGRGSPSTEFLQAYDFIIWYTGYDWFQPITGQENQALYDYLQSGGRLFLTSQDYLYYHGHQSLVRDFFGMLTYQESITPTQVYAGDQAIIPNELSGPVPLNYPPYLNNSDGLLPTDMNRVVLWGDQGMAAGLINAGLTETGQDWRVLFWSIPFEVMTATVQAPAMNGIMGWLGDLGDSTFVTDKRVVATGAPQTYTLTLKNLASAPTNDVMITNTLPVGLDILPQSLAGGAAYDAATRQIIWQGTLAPGAQHIIHYQAVPGSGQRLDNRVTIYYERHGLAFKRTATVWVQAPDLSQSQLTAVTNLPHTNPLITYTLRLRNDGLTVTDGISAVVRLPDALYPLTDTLHFEQGAGFLADQRIHWQGDLMPGAAITVSLQMTATASLETQTLPATAVVQDGVTDTQVFYHLLHLRPFTFYLSFIAKE